jgi:hypothetical protein
VQAVEELALEGPFKLGMVQIAGMKVEIVGMDRDVGILELDDDFDAFALRASGEVEKRMLVEAELGEHAVEAGLRRFWHGMILIDDVTNHREHRMHREIFDRLHGGRLIPRS